MEFESPALLKSARQFVDALPHAKALGLVVEKIGPGSVVIAMPWDPKLIGDPATGVIHGGAVSTLMDTASGSAVMLHPKGPRMTSTLDLRIDYMRAAHSGQTIRAHAECHHMTRSVAFIRVTAYDDDAAHPVATGTGAFTVDVPRHELPEDQRQPTAIPMVEHRPEAVPIPAADSTRGTRDE